MRKNFQTMHALNREVTQWESQCINLFRDDNKIPIRKQIKTTWDDCGISVAWLTEHKSFFLKSLPYSVQITAWNRNVI